jgi:hypothetical protein
VFAFVWRSYRRYLVPENKKAPLIFAAIILGAVYYNNFIEQLNHRILRIDLQAKSEPSIAFSKNYL